MDQKLIFPMAKIKDLMWAWTANSGGRCRGGVGMMKIWYVQQQTVTEAKIWYYRGGQDQNIIFPDLISRQQLKIWYFNFHNSQVRPEWIMIIQINYHNSNMIFKYEISMPRADQNRNRTKTEQNRVNMVKSGSSMTKYNKHNLNRPNQNLNSFQCRGSEQRSVLVLNGDGQWTYIAEKSQTNFSSYFVM